ncbi:MAG: thioredoxin family protein [Candidatus Microthrix parvicella]
MSDDDALLAVVKADCPTCVMATPALQRLAAQGASLLSQDDPHFPEGIAHVTDDTDLVLSARWGIEVVPTLLRVSDGVEVDRVEGWDRARWVEVSGIDGLGAGLPDRRPGCGSLTLDPSRADELLVRARSDELIGRRITLTALEDDADAYEARGWSDGLPVVPPTEARVLRMLEGTDRTPADVVAIVPPDLTPATVEKVAINAVLAGCRPEYLPVVLTAVEAACTDAFNMHGLLATTWFAGPMVVVSGPIARDISMNDGLGALGQGNRANATIGRALNLVVRNIGGGRPGGVDRATLGNPGKYTFCFAETPAPDPDWPNQATETGLAPDTSAVTLVAAEGVTGIIDQLSRTPESLARSFAEVLATVAHPKLAFIFDASLVISPEHLRVFREAGWNKARLRGELSKLLMLDGADLVRGARDIAEGMPEGFCGGTLPKFREGGLSIFQAGGGAGMFSAVIGGWAAGDLGSTPVTLPIHTPEEATT